MITLYTNLRNGSTTQLTGLNFNSACVFNGKCLLCNQSGVDELVDASGAESLFGTFVTTLGHPGQKDVRYLYIDLETDGELIVTPIVDGVRQLPVSIVPVAAGRQRIRTKVGRGAKGWFWDFEVVNVDGCWFSIHSAEVLPTYHSI